MDNAGNVVKARRKGPKVMGLKHIMAQKETPIENLPADVKAIYGALATRFIMFVYGDSFNGKTSFLYSFLKWLMVYYQVLYWAGEEGFTMTTRSNISEYLDEEVHSGKILFADADMQFEDLMEYLKRKKSPHVVVIDSVQYMDMNYAKYKLLKETFKRKIFILISQTQGGKPTGAPAKKMRFDADIKVLLMGFTAFVGSRFNKGQPPRAVVNWPEGARKFWKAKYKTVAAGELPKGIKP